MAGLCGNCGEKQAEFNASQINSKHPLCSHCLIGWFCEWVFLHRHPAEHVGDQYSPVEGRVSVEKIGDVEPALGIRADQVAKPA